MLKEREIDAPNAHATRLAIDYGIMLLQNRLAKYPRLIRDDIILHRVGSDAISLEGLVGKEADAEKILDIAASVLPGIQIIDSITVQGSNSGDGR